MCLKNSIFFWSDSIPPNGPMHYHAPQSLRSPQSSKSPGSQNLQPTVRRNKPVSTIGQEKLTVIDGDLKFTKAKDCDTPAGWVPASRTFPFLDVIICTDSKKKPLLRSRWPSPPISQSQMAFERLEKHHLLEKFQSARTRTRCHVFVTDRSKKMQTLCGDSIIRSPTRRATNISIYFVVW